MWLRASATTEREDIVWAVQMPDKQRYQRSTKRQNRTRAAEKKNDTSWRSISLDTISKVRIPDRNIRLLEKLHVPPDVGLA